jgi:hypothetical protein
MSFWTLLLSLPADSDHRKRQDGLHTPPAEDRDLQDKNRDNPEEEAHSNIRTGLEELGGLSVPTQSKMQCNPAQRLIWKVIELGRGEGQVFPDACGRARTGCKNSGDVYQNGYILCESVQIGHRSHLAFHNGRAQIYAA